MTRVLLIDDERKATDSLRLLFERFIGGAIRVESCNDARLAAQIIHQYEPDLVFLDIRMPHLSGFDILDTVVNRKFRVIFTTAFDEYAIRAIRFSAFDYLLKPVDAEELVAAFQRFLQARQEEQLSPELYSNISHNLSLQNEGLFRLALPSREGVYFLYPHEIIRCEALSAYTRFYTTGGKQLLSSRNLGEYEELLTPYHFIRTHKSHLVNRQFISFLDHEGFVVLKDSSRIEVSRRRKEEVMEQLRQS